VNGLLCYCRAGFEPDLAAELVDRAAEAGVAGYPRAERGSGHVLFLGEDAAMAARLPWSSLVFARQSLALFAELRGLDPADRIGAMLGAIEAAAPASGFGDVWVEHPDSDAGKPLSGLARSFANALRPALRKRGLLAAVADQSLPRLHVCFLAGDHALLASAQPARTSPWPLGVPRLKLHADAPSRSALKLEEALMVLLGPAERRELLGPGMRAADLGAAPGGWTWVLARHGVHVTAIDNGPLRPHLFETGLVEHLREDGFRWQPPRPLDWMVCDMVEQPSRVARRMGEWFGQGWCRQSVFNLKLPMKKRWLETQRSVDAFRSAAGVSVTVRARQLYHDREEITVFARRGAGG
jgi:23S rRNA (cytidine2498-2'-O)-methyltransferase